MHIPGDDHWLDWEPEEPGHLEVGTDWGRRRLLGSAASGLILMASGVFLPTRHEDAQARESVRRGNHRGRHKHHNRNKHKHKDKKRKQSDDLPRGAASGGNRNVAIHVHNYRTVPVQVQGWQFDHYDGSGPQAQRKFAVPDGWGWQAIPARAADGSHSTRSFVCTRDRDVSEPRIVTVQIGTDYFVWCYNNPFWWPDAEIYSGSWGSDGRAAGGKLLGASYMFVNESFSRDGIKVTRLEDTGDHIQFSVDL